ncbi:unnamed protein product [Fusarium fujikuroi]|uniref:Rhodopsin domain-containing protein n=1 Tax=Fusarium fujikuroi TaxID=5127 RepID=A0A9Q9RLQ6_FUSFU|nr:unnamed protein product [Fusarium fujikuroi]VZH93036.1 unnamed protein product [Fusarium fujikuroi]
MSLRRPETQDAGFELCSKEMPPERRISDAESITLIAITAIVVGLRLWHKLRYERKFRLDDYIIVAVFLLDLGNTIVCVHGLSGNGLGRDAWLFSPDTINSYLCYLYIGQTLYASDVFLTKICVALFYLRIFPVVSVQRLIWGTIVFSVLGMILFDILAIAQCQPISFYWTGWDKLHEGHCLGVQPLAWAIAAVGIILDVWMLAIPIWQLVQLQMKWQRKLAVAIMFTVGTFVTIVSILRLRYLVAFGNSQNPTWDSFETCYWSVIEINVGLWCVCLPDLRMLILKAFPRLGSSIESGPRNPHQGSSAPRQQGRTPNSSRHTESTIYKGKPIQAQQEASSSTAELVEMTTFMNDNKSLSKISLNLSTAKFDNIERLQSNKSELQKALAEVEAAIAFLSTAAGENIRGSKLPADLKFSNELSDGKLQPRPSKASVHIAREEAPPFFKLDPRFQQDKWIRPKPPGSSCFSNEIVQWAYTRIIEDDEGVEYPLLTLRHHKASKCITGKACETGHWELIYDGVTTRVKGCIDLQLACMRTKHVEREMSSLSQEQATKW